MAEMSRDGMRTCPSAQADMVDARIIGVITHEQGAPRVAYLGGAQAVSPAEFVDVPAELAGHVFRLAAKCEENRCAQFKDGRCSLGQRVAEQLAAVVDALPSCVIRSTCRWFTEQGSQACLRCPQITTLVPADGSRLAEVAKLPQVPDR